MAHSVLCVDDYLPGLTAMRRVLEHAGFTVEGTTEPSSAVELAQNAPFDAVVIDFQMPGTTGATLARLLKQQHPKLPVLLISAYPADVPPEAVHWVDGFLRKGHQIARELPAAVGRLISDTNLKIDTEQQLRKARHDDLEIDETLATKLSIEG